MKVAYLAGTHNESCEGRLRCHPTYDRLHCYDCGLTILRDGWPSPINSGPVKWVIDSFLVREWP